MRLKYDGHAKALYITLAEGEVARTAEIDDGTLCDLDAAGRLLGIEVLRRYAISGEDAAMLMAGYPFAFSVGTA